MKVNPSYFSILLENNAVIMLNSMKLSSQKSYMKRKGKTHKHHKFFKKRQKLRAYSTFFIFEKRNFCTLCLVLQ